MKKLLFLFLASHLMIGTLTAQSSNEAAVKQIIDTFYAGFNERDSVKMKLALSKNMLYQNVEEVYGQRVVENADLLEIIRTIVAIPKTTKFRQDIDGLQIYADDNIASAWVTYKFYLYDAYYHCGSGAMQLAKEDGNWKIISLLDNYSRAACNK